MSKWTPVDVVMVHQIVEEKLKNTTNQMAIRNLNRILNNLQETFEDAEFREGHILYDAISERNAKRTD